MQLTPIPGVPLPFTLNLQEFADMDTWQHPNDSHEVVTKKSPTVLRAKTCHSIVVVLIAKDDIFNRTFERWHTTMFSLSGDRLETVRVYISTRISMRRVRQEQARSPEELRYNIDRGNSPNRKYYQRKESQTRHDRYAAAKPQ